MSIRNDIITVSDIPICYNLVNIDYEVSELNKAYNQDFGCYFILIDNGEYLSIYGCESNIPYLYKPVYKVL